MPDPAVSLVSAALLLLGLAALFWPIRGLVWRWRKMRQTSGRVLIEDALKHLHDNEYSEQPTSVQSLAGALGVSSNRSAKLLARIEALTLVQRNGGSIRLTADGRRDALRVIRLHRLWESYLSQETGVDATQWHDEAELREHSLSPVEAQELAAQLGDPAYDPHGDPIPTAAGELPPLRGQAMPSLAAGTPAVIIHLEDEPDAVYAELLAAGLSPGLQVRITTVSPEKVCFQMAGGHRELTPISAANVTVLPLPPQHLEAAPQQNLTDLIPGEQGKVLRIGQPCRGVERRRLMDLGVVPGTQIQVEMRSAGGDPVAYRIRGALIALRNDLACHIQVQRDLTRNQ